MQISINRRKSFSLSILISGTVTVCLLAFTSFAQADSLVPPDDPRQSITYWKSHTISADSDPQVRQTHDIFNVLLRAWDRSRLDPGLYVVRSEAGPWAASLADGNILLSRKAIEICMQYGDARGEHLLAFVLAHELAHQRADDLWHQRFFRMVGTQSPSAQQHIMRGLSLGAQQIQQLEQKEAQADHDGLILMSSVGYDPYQVLDKKDFFTEWVENIWQSSCHETTKKTSTHNKLNSACKQAQSRALRTRLQLDTIASQSMLYQMGIQAFVAKNYPLARHYFTVFGRDYPSRAIISAISMTYLAQAEEVLQALIHQGDLKQAAFYYPLLLDASINANMSDGSRAKRASADGGKKQKKQLQQLVKQGIKQLERAIDLEPHHRKSYLLLASAYLMANNTYMARGVLQGRYLKRFSKDSAVDLILAMTRSIEGEHKKAQLEFKALLNRLSSSDKKSSMPENLLIYSAFYNSAANATLIGNQETASATWQQLARLAKNSGNSLLFRMSLEHIRPGSTTSNSALTNALMVDGYRLKDKLSANNRYKINELWIEGEKYNVNIDTNGSHFITLHSGVIINAWQNTHGSIAKLLSIGDKPDRPLKTLGIPDRQLHMLSGDYLAYDSYGLALHINQNKVQSWFLY